MASSSPAKHGHGQSERQPKQVKIVSDKVDIFTNKHADVQLSASRQKKIQGLHKKDVFKVVTPNKVIPPEKFPNSIQVFNSRFVDNRKDPCTDKADEKSRPVVYVYNDDVMLWPPKSCDCIYPPAFH